MTQAAHRIGQPAPLIFHLSSALAAYGQAILAAPNAAEPAFPWHPDGERYRGPAPEPLAVALEAVDRLSQMIRGIEAWQSHPYRRQMPEPPVIWSQGATRLLDYGATPQATNPDGPIVVVVPSLINRAYILDLDMDCSFLRGLAAAGLRPLLLDWGEPGRLESGFDLGDYMSRRLVPSLALAQGLGRRPPALLGYCMGGTLAIGHALTGPDLGALVAIGAPWDFAAAGGLGQQVRAGARHSGITLLGDMIDGLGNAFGAVPPAVFQQLFALVDPIQAARKFARFSRLPADSPRAERFVALEDWLCDGVAMAAPAARTLLIDWQLLNATAEGRWPTEATAATRPLATRIPTLIVAGQKDSIAQPPMAHGALRALPHAQMLSPPLGHVGMITGATAQADVLAPVVDFLRSATARTP